MTSRAPLSGAGHVSVCFVIGQLGGQRERGVVVSERGWNTKRPTEGDRRGGGRFG